MNSYEQAHLLSLPNALKEGPTNWFSGSLISFRLKLDTSWNFTFAYFKVFWL